MNVVVVANRGDGDDGFVGERLGELGANFIRVWREDPDGLADAELDADLVLSLGSDWSVYDASTAPSALSAAPERALVRRAARRGVPVLGICYGGQLCASALGAEVRRAEQPEIGWRLLESDDVSFCGTGPWFQYHFDRWSDGGPVRSFMRNQVSPQAFVFGRTLGLQFHPEVTPATVSTWLRAAPDDVAAAGGVIEEIEAETALLADDARLRCHRLVDAFFDTVASAPVWDVVV
ncbi:MAG TPA: gamma-glutamyl-gamma-aminobutyrate hydrolase family protein [Acidimicrobiales bacterium]